MSPCTFELSCWLRRYLRWVGDLDKHVSTVLLQPWARPGRRESTYFVEVLQQINNAALNLWLRETGSGGVASCSGEDGWGLLERWSGGNWASNWAGSADSLAGGAACGLEEDCAKHGEDVWCCDGDLGVDDDAGSRYSVSFSRLLSFSWR